MIAKGQPVARLGTPRSAGDGVGVGGFMPEVAVGSAALLDPGLE